MKLFLAPHNDDEALFGAFIIQREKPLVLIVTDGQLHQDRGIALIEQRRAESVAGCAVLGAPVAFLCFSDASLDRHRDELWDRLRYFKPTHVWVPAVLDNGNPDHNLIGEVAEELWGQDENVKLMRYYTYKRDDLEPRGDVEIKPNGEEIEIKKSALGEYRTQIKANPAHFAAVQGKSEFLVNGYH